MRAPGRGRFSGPGPEIDPFSSSPRGIAYLATVPVRARCFPIPNITTRDPDETRPPH